MNKEEIKICFDKNFPSDCRTTDNYETDSILRAKNIKSYSKNKTINYCKYYSMCIRVNKNKLNWRNEKNDRRKDKIDN